MRSTGRCGQRSWLPVLVGDERKGAGTVSATVKQEYTVAHRIHPNMYIIGWEVKPFE